MVTIIFYVIIKSSRGSLECLLSARRHEVKSSLQGTLEAESPAFPSNWSGKSSKFTQLMIDKCPLGGA